MSKQTHTTIYLVRHGESESNKNKLIGGHVDSALTELGREQVSLTKEKLEGVRFDEIYSSDLQRAAETARIISGRPVPEDHKLAGLRERTYGSLEGNPEHILAEGNARRHAMTHEEGWKFKHAHDMESDHDLELRYLPALETVARDNAGKTVLVAGHGGVIRMIMMKIAGYTYQQIPSGSFGNAGYIKLDYSPRQGFKVIQINGVKL